MQTTWGSYSPTLISRFRSVLNPSRSVISWNPARSSPSRALFFLGAGSEQLDVRHQLADRSNGKLMWIQDAFDMGMCGVSAIDVYGSAICLIASRNLPRVTLPSLADVRKRLVQVYPENDPGQTAVLLTGSGTSAIEAAPRPVDKSIGEIVIRARMPTAA